MNIEVKLRAKIQLLKNRSLELEREIRELKDSLPKDSLATIKVKVEFLETLTTDYTQTLADLNLLQSILI